MRRAVKPRRRGLRAVVHAHSPESMKRTAMAGCTQVEHGSLADAESLKLLADKGVWFDPNIGVVIQNYLENKAHFLGIGNYNEEGFAYMEKAIPLNRTMYAQALKTPGLKMVMGTDAVAGAHGHNVRETIERIRQGQKPMAAIMEMTSLAAESMSTRQSDWGDCGRTGGGSGCGRRQPDHRLSRIRARALRDARGEGLQTLMKKEARRKKKESD